MSICKNWRGNIQLRKSLNEGINLLSGHSGVGKSTIINEIVPGLNLKLER